MPALLLFSLSAALAAAAGVAAFALWPGAAHRAGGLLEAAAGGALIIMGAAFLAPEALVLAPGAATMALIALGAAAGLVLQRGASLLAGPRAGALSLLTGLGLHSLLDGAAFSVALAADPVFALGSAAGLVLHDAPKALFAFLLLRRAGLGQWSSAAGAMLIAAGLSAFGAVAAAPVAGAMPLDALGGLIGIAAGLLIYSGAACLFTLRERPFWAKAGAAAAAATLVAAVGQLGHSHAVPEAAPAAAAVAL